MIRETLVGDYWTRVRRHVSHNEGRFPERRWDLDRTAQRRDSRVSTAGQHGNGIVWSRENPSDLRSGEEVRQLIGLILKGRPITTKRRDH